MIINQIRTFTPKDKENIIPQIWVCNPDEHCQVKGIGNISSEDEEPQQKEGKEGKKKGEDSENGNLSDCDQAVRVHKHIVEEKVTRKQQKAIVKNVEVEKDNLDNCNRGNINMNMNNGAEDIPCVMNENLLQNEHVGSEGSRLSTCGKKVPISRKRDFYGKYEMRCKPIAN
jgi:hypothetical protein